MFSMKVRIDSKPRVLLLIVAYALSYALGDFEHPWWACVTTFFILFICIGTIQDQNWLDFLVDQFSNSRGGDV